MNKLSILPILLLTGALQAQIDHPDTVEVHLASTSKLVLTVQDPSDLSQLRQYDYQALMDDMLRQLDTRHALDSLINLIVPPSPPLPPAPEKDYDAFHHRNKACEDHGRSRYPGRFSHYVNVSFGLNNYLENGTFPDAAEVQYSIRPWGSWYVGLDAVHRLSVSKRFHLEGSLGIHWYNFKFDKEDTHLHSNAESIFFSPDPRDLDFIKSKLTICYLQAALIPVLATGNGYGYRVYKHSCSSGFRIGLGPYAGYRIDSYARQQYRVDHEKEANRDHDPFHLQDLRYGLRLQVGINTVDFFFNYDLNELFREKEGPRLHGYSFGLIF